MPRTSKINYDQYCTEPGVLACKFCKEFFVSKLGIKQHFFTFHFDKKIYQCDTCHKLFISIPYISKHIFEKHDYQNNCLLFTEYIIDENAGYSKVVKPLNEVEIEKVITYVKPESQSEAKHLQLCSLKYVSINLFVHKSKFCNYSSSVCLTFM